MSDAPGSPSAVAAADAQARGLIGFAQAAAVDLSGLVAIAGGTDPDLSLAVGRLAQGAETHLLRGPRAAPFQLEPQPLATVFHHDYADENVIPVRPLLFDRLVILPGSLGGRVGLYKRVCELRRTLARQGVIIVGTGPLLRGPEAGPHDDRVRLDELQRAFVACGASIVKVHLETPPTRLTPADHQFPLSQLAVHSAWLLAVTVG